MVTDMEHVIGGVFKKVADTDEWPVNYFSEKKLYLTSKYNGWNHGR